MNDSYIWKNSAFHQALRANNLGLPDKAVFVADDAFPLTQNIMKPYPKKGQFTYKQKIFNYRLSRARRIVENAFGIMASRFRIFRKPISVSLDKTDSIIKTACALHNWLRSNSAYMNDLSFMDEEHNENENIKHGRNNQRYGLNDITRSLTSNHPLQDAKRLRDNFAEYFVSQGAVTWQDKMIV